MAIYFNDGTKVRNASQIHMGIDGQPKKIQSIYYGINGKGKLIYSGKSKIAILSQYYNKITNYYVKTKVMPEVETYGYLQTPDSEYEIVTPDTTSSQVQTDWGFHYIGPGNIYTRAEKIEINGVSGRIFNNSATHININLNHFIFNNTVNFCWSFSKRNLEGSFKKSNFNSGQNFYHCFDNSKCSYKDKLNIMVSTITSMATKENIIKMCFYTTKFNNIDLTFEVIPTGTNSWRLFESSIFNTVNLIGNFNHDYTQSLPPFEKININTLNLNVEFNTANLLFSNILSSTSFKGKITSSYFSNCFNNVKSGGYLYLDFPSTTFTTSDFMKYRGSGSSNCLYIKVKNYNLADNIQSNIKMDSEKTSSYSWSTMYDYMPDDPYNKYLCYYCDDANIRILYGDPIP